MESRAGEVEEATDLRLGVAQQRQTVACQTWRANWGLPELLHRSHGRVLYVYRHVYIFTFNLWCSVIITVIILLYSLLVWLLLLSLSKPQASIVLLHSLQNFYRHYYFISTVTAAAATSLYYYLLLITIFTIVHCRRHKNHRYKKTKDQGKRQKRKKNQWTTPLCHPLSVMIFLAVFYSLQSSHVLFCNALPTAAAFYHSATGNLSNGKRWTTDIHIYYNIKRAIR